MFKGILSGIIGFFTKKSEAKAKLKQVKLDGEIRINEAKINAEVNRIKENTVSDNNIDLETVKNMKNTYKDEFIVVLFLLPFFTILNVVPFIVAYQNSSWTNLTIYIQESVNVLNSFPDWYKYVVGLIVIGTLGFRSLLRKVIESKINKKL